METWFIVFLLIVFFFDFFHFVGHFDNLDLLLFYDIFKSICFLMNWWNYYSSYILILCISCWIKWYYIGCDRYSRIVVGIRNCLWRTKEVFIEPLDASLELLEPLIDYGLICLRGLLKVLLRWLRLQFLVELLDFKVNCCCRDNSWSILLEVKILCWSSDVLMVTAEIGSLRGSMRCCYSSIRRVRYWLRCDWLCWRWCYRRWC